MPKPLMIAKALVLIVARIAVWQLVFKAVRKNVPIRVLEHVGQVVVVIVQVLVALLASIVVVIIVQQSAVQHVRGLAELDVNSLVEMHVMVNVRGDVMVHAPILHPQQQNKIQ